MTRSIGDEEEEEEDGSRGWDPAECWDAKVSSCAALLQAGGGGVVCIALTAVDPLPDSLLTVVQVLLMPSEAYEEFTSDSSHVGGIGFLDDSAVREDPQEFGAAVVSAIVACLDARMAQLGGPRESSEVDGQGNGVLQHSPWGGVGGDVIGVGCGEGGGAGGVDSAPCIGDRAPVVAGASGRNAARVLCAAERSVLHAAKMAALALLEKACDAGTSREGV